MQTRIGTTGWVPVKGVDRIQPSLPESFPQPGVRPLTLGEVDPLRVLEQLQPGVVFQTQRKDRLAQRAGQADLGKAPLGDNRGGAAQKDDTVSPPQLDVKLRLPVASGGDTPLGVEVEEQRVEVLSLKPLREALGGGPVAAAVRDEQ